MNMPDEADEMLAFLGHANFDAYRAGLREAVEVSGTAVAPTRKQKQTPAAGDDDGERAGVLTAYTAEGKAVAMRRPTYMRIDELRERLVQSVRDASVRYAHAEQRVLTTSDSDLGPAKEAWKRALRDLSDLVAHLSHLLAYRVILARVVTERHHQAAIRRAEDLLEQRRKLLASGKLDGATLRETARLFSEAEKQIDHAHGEWPGKHAHLVVEPPRVVAQPAQQQTRRRRPLPPPRKVQRTQKTGVRR